MHRIIEQNLEEITRICTHRRVRRLAVFGSATDDRFDPDRSDLDLLVEFEKMQPAEHADQYFGLAEDLERLLNRPVDLVEPGESAIRISANPLKIRRSKFMQPHETKKYFFDIAEASDLIAQFTAGKTLADYQNDPLLRSGVERQFEIIGEALNQAIRHDPFVAELISNSSRIISFRNRLIHGYATISDKVVWGVLETNLPTLNREVKALLEKDDD